MTRKNLLCKCGTTRNGYDLLPAPGGSEKTWVWKLVGLEMCWIPATKMWRETKIMASVLRWAPKKGSHTRQAAAETKPWTCMLELQQKTRTKIQGLCLPSLSLWHVVSLCPANMVDSAFILCFPAPNDYLKSVVANKLLF